MFAPSLSAEQQRQLANKLTTFLSQYTNLSDSYIIEFFTEDLWATLPISWQVALRDLSYPQVADLLLDGAKRDRRYPSVWPLSLLAFRSTAHGLAFPRCERGGGSGAGALKPEEFLENASQSSLLGHIFRKHVKPKKQHEIRKLGLLVKQLCDQTDCRKVVDVGSGQGHLTRFLSFGLGLSVTGIEADHTLATMASRFDAQLLWALEKERQKKNSSSQLPVPGSSPRHVASWVNPKASWEAFIEQLSSAECVSEGHPTPSGPSKKRLRGSGQPGRAQETGPALGPADSSAPCAVNPSQDVEMAPQQRLSENEESSPNTCCVQPLSQEGRRPAEDSPQAYQDFVLTGLHACGDLSATLLRHFVNCPHVRGITSVACCYMKISTKENPTPPGLVEPSPSVPPAPDHETSPSQFGYPMSSWVRGLPGHQLSYKAREGACHAIEDYVRRLREESALLRTHCYRAMLETIIRSARPELRRAGIQTIKKAHMLPFTEYARLGLARVSLPAALALDLDPEQVEALLEQQGRVVVFFSLALLLAPVVETLVLLDRIIYLQEQGVDSKLVPLFDPNFSPRNFVLVALKPHVDRGGT
ncbi:methyltransferase-like protein 25B [Myripristis murdjan]|uniref:Methyltransferase like 25B n=1 Tax=Myripristis murdjan TaxID=586833 RepID=A0A667ZLT7_9TELE|nr:protein RRNAD1 [Myripristis murdjan]XP_029927402.1 protein RRNAD1 [Myripristis murdjan]